MLLGLLCNWQTYESERLLIMEMPYAYAPFKGEGVYMRLSALQWEECYIQLQRSHTVRGIMRMIYAHMHISRENLSIGGRKCEFLYLKGARISSYSKWKFGPLEKWGNNKYKSVNLIKFQLLKWA